jgi:multimeric flavodoxin WrbA
MKDTGRLRKDFMKAIAINGSPRKKWNTATLLESALSGCQASGAKIEMVHLYDYAYQGCTSCFGCKKIGGKSYGRCAMRDELSPLLDRAMQADVLLLGSPLYFHTETGEMRSFMERLLYPSYSYTPDRASLFPRKIPTALVYTMNATEEEMPTYHQDASVAASRDTMARIFGSCEVLLSTDTYQFKDYSKYLSTAWDPEVKAKRREDVFPQDCERAYELGTRLTAAAR